MTGRRMAVAGMTAVAAAILWSSPAWAAGETVVSFDGDPGSGSEITVEAGPGKANNISVRESSDNGFYVFGDPVGIVETSPHCTQPSPTRVSCPVQGLRALEIRTGDGPDVVRSDWMHHQACTQMAMGPGNDRIAVGNFDPKACAEDFVLGFPYEFMGGSGRDRLQLEVDSSAGRDSERTGAVGGPGADSLSLTGSGTIMGGAGADALKGVTGPQKILGGSGPDLLKTAGPGRDLCEGGPGKDIGAAAGCERGVWEQDPIAA